MSGKEIRNTQETIIEETEELTGSELEQGNGGIPGGNPYIRRQIKKLLKDKKGKEPKDGGATGGW